MPANYHIILKTHDQDSDADLWRENILFGKRTSRYLCISKQVGIDDHVLSELKVIGEKENVPMGFTHIQRTVDTDQKAWRKRSQIIYKVNIFDFFLCVKWKILEIGFWFNFYFQLSKKDTITHAITDIILCSKLRRPPDGFKLAGWVKELFILKSTE